MLKESLMLLGMIPMVLGCKSHMALVNGVEEAKVAVAKKDSDKNVLDNSGNKCVHSNNTLNHVSKKVRGSWFEILSEDMEENFGAVNGQSRTFKQKKPELSKVLSKILNRERSRKL
ncbi:hypothetical protein QYF36_019144 [Acer negundo]|nr:hypothetical protein QYF36_019144 [Acer negundo]